MGCFPSRFARRETHSSFGSHRAPRIKLKTYKYATDRPQQLLASTPISRPFPLPPSPSAAPRAPVSSPKRRTPSPTKKRKRSSQHRAPSWPPPRRSSRRFSLSPLDMDAPSFEAFRSKRYTGKNQPYALKTPPRPSYESSRSPCPSVPGSPQTPTPRRKSRQRTTPGYTSPTLRPPLPIPSIEHTLAANFVASRPSSPRPPSLRPSSPLPPPPCPSRPASVRARTKTPDTFGAGTGSA